MLRPKLQQQLSNHFCAQDRTTSVLQNIKVSQKLMSSVFSLYRQTYAVLNSVDISIILFIISGFAKQNFATYVTSNGLIIGTNASDTKHPKMPSYFFQYMHKTGFIMLLFSF